MLVRYWSRAEWIIFPVTASSLLFRGNIITVFCLSLVLSYLPSPDERRAYGCQSKGASYTRKPQATSYWRYIDDCRKRYPFSLPSGCKGNLYSRYLKTWKRALKRLGFAMVKYELKVCGDKRMHLMACRVVDVDSITTTVCADRLYIRADLKGTEDVAHELCDVEFKH